MSSVYVTSCTPKSMPVIKLDDFKRNYISNEGEYDELVSYGFSAGHHGYISIVCRRTGFGWRDIETGFRDTYAMSARGKENYGKNFWLASGNFDIRNQAGTHGMDWDDAVDFIKRHANTCVGQEV